MSKIRMPESAGWIFFGVVFCLLIYPLYLVMTEVTIDTDEATTARITFSVFGAAIVAAMLTWVANLLLERITLWVRKPVLRKLGKGPGKAKHPAKKH
jgi:uncharacterized membrane protein YvlD (DUF360 family)